MVRRSKEPVPAMSMRRRACLFSAAALALATLGVPAVAQQAGVGLARRQLADAT